LQFTSKSQYKLADLSAVAGSPLDSGRNIYSAGYPFDAKNIRITKGTVSQTTDIPFDDGTQVGYVIDKGEKGIRQGMSGGAIVDSQGLFIGINTIGIAPILPDYTYNDGSKPIPKLKAEYTRANWGIPVYNFLARVKADILYDYNLPKVLHQVTPTGYMANLNDKARKMTVRIENSGGNGSGVIVAKEGGTYYVLTAKHVVQDKKDNTHQKFSDGKIITYDQDNYPVISTVVAESQDLAIVKFTSNNPSC
jgi:S1-C subfamily serine protease